MANIVEILAHGCWPVSRRMVAQDPPKHQCGPFLIRTELFLSPHIEHTDGLTQLMALNQFCHTVSHKLTPAFPSRFKLLDQRIQIRLVLLLVLPFILIYGFCISNDETAASAHEVLLHLQVLVQAPVVQIFLHVLYHYCGGLFGLHDYAYGYGYGRGVYNDSII